MLQIGKTIISLDVIQKEFCCDLDKCKGACCVDGDSGAPMTPEEARLIEEMYPEFEIYLSEMNKAEIKKQGFSVIDGDGDLVTPIVGNNECVFTFTDEQELPNAPSKKHILTNIQLSGNLFPVTSFPSGSQNTNVLMQ